MKTWFITGSSTGIGRGIAESVLAKGEQAVVTARNTKSLQDLVDRYPDTCLAVSLELNNSESIQASITKAFDKFSKIDVLVNNAGYGYRAAVEEGEVDKVMSMFNANFFGAVELIKLVLPKMREQRSGTIINISSIAAARTGAASGYYAASKAAIESLTEGLKAECEPLGIKVMIVEPGAFKTDFYDRSLAGTDIKIDDYANTAGPRRKENAIDPKNQPGDPMKAGQVIVEVCEQAKLPKRLLLGSDALRIVKAALEDRLKEMDEYASYSQQSDY